MWNYYKILFLLVVVDASNEKKVVADNFGGNCNRGD